MGSKSRGVSTMIFLVTIFAAIITSVLLSTVIATQLAVGPQGEQGPAGPTGATGPQGPTGGFGAPDYDSGWNTVTVAADLTHNLGTQEILVYLYARNSGGGIVNGQLNWWIVDDNTLQIIRPVDSGLSEEYRVLIWKID